MIKPVDIAIIGVQKAATSSLQTYLGQHPQLLTHGEKEFTFFIIDEEYNAGYKKSFEKFFSSPDSSKKNLIKNVGIIFNENAMQRLYYHNPLVKIILVLRNPISRAYSAFWYAVMCGYENEKTFESALKAGTERFHNKLKRQMVDYLGRGDYVFQINNLYKYFSTEQVKIILYEDLKNTSLFHELFEFCEIDVSFKPNTIKKINESGKARLPWLAKMIRQQNIVKSLLRKLVTDNMRLSLKIKLNKMNKKEFTPPPINPVTKKKLIEHYQPMIKELSVMINRDLSQWVRID